jgi:hypothetical protein
MDGQFTPAKGGQGLWFLHPAICVDSLSEHVQGDMVQLQLGLRTKRSCSYFSGTYITCNDNPAR